MTVTRRYPFGPLAAAMGLSPNQACKALGLGGASQKEYRRIGMSELVADRLAVRAGVHPATIWPEWVEDHLGDLHKKKVAQVRRRYQKSPKVRTRKAALRAVYYAEYGEYERQAERERYWRDVEETRRKRRARYWANPERERERQRQWRARQQDRPQELRQGEGRLQGRHEDQIVKNLGESERADVAS